MLKVNFDRDDVFAPLMSAVSAKNYRVIKKLINKGASVKQAEGKPYSLLGIALHKKSDFKIIRLLVENGAQLDAEYSDLPLIGFVLSIYGDDPENRVLEYLLNAGMPVGIDKVWHKGIFDYAEKVHKRYPFANYGGVLELLKAAKAKK